METILSKDVQGTKEFDLSKLGVMAASEGTIIGGFIVAHVALKALKKSDDLLINGAVAVGGLVGAMLIPNPWLKLVCLGASAYSAIKCLNIGVKAATEPGTAGLGFIPDNVKAKIRIFLPTLGDAGNGIGADDISKALAAIDLSEVSLNGGENEVVDLGYAQEMPLGSLI